MADNNNLRTTTEPELDLNPPSSLLPSSYNDTNKSKDWRKYSQKLTPTTEKSTESLFLYPSPPLLPWTQSTCPTSLSSPQEKENERPYKSSAPLPVPERKRNKSVNSLTSNWTRKTSNEKLSTTKTSTTPYSRSSSPTNSPLVTRKGSKKSFRLRSKSVFLTYPRCDLEKEKLKKVCKGKAKTERPHSV